MTQPVQAAVDALSAVLAQENAALTALDPRRAAGLLEAKRQATDALARAGTLHPGALPSRTAAERLRDLALENRRLLERAITVQGRVIGIVARAAARPVAAPRYAAHGGMARVGRTGPVALSARA